MKNYTSYSTIGLADALGIEATITNTRKTTNSGFGSITGLNDSFAYRQHNAPHAATQGVADVSQNGTQSFEMGLRRNMTVRKAKEILSALPGAPRLLNAVNGTGSIGAEKQATLIRILASVLLAGALYMAASVATASLHSPISGLQNHGLHFAAFPLRGGGNTMTAQQAARLIDWPQGIAGTGLKIGMIDGGINLDHRALVGQDIHARDFRTDKSLPVPMNHGTAVAAVMVGREQSREFKGLLPNATLFAANIFSKDSRGRVSADPMAFLAAIDWMIEMDVSVINVSLTGQDDPIINRAIRRALNHDVLIVAAAGNNRGIYGRDYPAAYDGVLAATAVDSDLNIYRYASLGEHIDFAAPGVSVKMAANRGSQILSGTSFAAPFLTAAVAVALNDNSAADADAIRDQFSQDAKDLGRRGIDTVFGHGLIDAHDLDTGTVVARRDRADPAGPRPIEWN